MTIQQYFEQLRNIIGFDEAYDYEQFIYELSQDLDRWSEWDAWQTAHPEINFYSQSMIGNEMVFDFTMWCWDWYGD